MSSEVVMPRMSDTMETGTIGKWLKNEGDQVTEGEIVVEIETDKANMELQAFASGIMAQILKREGESAKIGEPIALIAANAEEAKSLKTPESQTQPAPGGSPAGAAPPDAGQPPAGQTQPEFVDEPARHANGASSGGQNGSDGRIKASPLARRIAQEHNLQLSDISGTGPGGRITKEDVQAFLKQGGVRPQPAPAAQPAAQPQAQPATYTPSAGRAPQPVEMTRMQKTIARRMAEARFSKPDFVLTAEIDMTRTMELLQSIKSTEGAPKVGPNDLLIKACALALRQHPDVNAGYENDTIVRYGRVNVGFAVAIEGGLVVPVIQDADQKPLGQIAREAKEFIGQARDGKLPPSAYEHGTFSISNLGMYGIDQFTPIINPPEACIMGVGAVTQKPVVLDGEIVVRDRMRVDLACDHRVINGVQGAEFLQTVRRLLENPMLALL